MMELWHDVGDCSWEVGEKDISRHGGVVGGGTCFSYEDLVRTWVDIRTRDVGGDYVVNGVGVGYFVILWGKEGVCGGAAGRGRRTRFSI